MEYVMKLQKVGASYGSEKVLSDISMEIPAHRITAVIGPSGCGKSTLLRCMNGMLSEEPGASAEGEIFLGDQNIKTVKTDILRRKVGLVFQTPSPFPFSIYKNMIYGPKYYGIRDKSELKRIAEEKLKMAGLFDEVKDVMGKSALNLSGGQQQRLCIARALSVEPEVLLLDEPCSALDVKASAVIEETLMQLKEKYTVVIVTHNIAQARRISDYGAFLFGGKLVEMRPSRELFTHPEEEKTREFLEGLYG